VLRGDLGNDKLQAGCDNAFSTGRMALMALDFQKILTICEADNVVQTLQAVVEELLVSTWNAARCQLHGTAASERSYLTTGVVPTAPF